MDGIEVSTGRVFILRLRTGEILHEEIERFALDNGIIRATVTAIGGIDAGSVITVGPEVPIEGIVCPIGVKVEAPMEFTGSGTIFPDEDGVPLLHMHGSCGRRGNSTTGCMHSGVIIWNVMEVVITELLSSNAYRKEDANGFKLLEVAK